MDMGMRHWHKCIRFHVAVQLINTSYFLGRLSLTSSKLFELLPEPLDLEAMPIGREAELPLPVLEGSTADQSSKGVGCTSGGVGSMLPRHPRSAFES
eukprot:5779221-Prymnesium_polylepis.3